MWGVGLFVAVLMALIVIGGVKRIANVAQVVAPVMAAVYIILSLVVLAVHWQVVPEVFMQMLRGAVGVNEVTGALIGTTIAWGVKRGIYSNEAGLGSGAIVAAAAKVSHPVKQGLVQAFSVYVDTLLVCTATAMMILACKTYNIIDSVGNDGTVTYLLQHPSAPGGEPGVFYTTEALGTVVGSNAGNIIIAVALFFFAFTTIVTYYYYSETNLVYLFNRWRRRIYKKHPEKLDELERADMKFGDDRREKIVIWVLRISAITAIIISSMQSSGFVWKLGDIGVGLMAWVTVVSILLLSPKAFASLKEYEALLEKRASHIPLQQILGYTEFMGLRFNVNEHVLCPRQDTETLVELAQKCLKPGMRVLDMCTGSGCILISLLALGCKGVCEPGGFIGVASDVSEEALAVAKENAKQNHVDIQVLQGDLFASLEALPAEERRFDLIVSNPPYIPTAGVWALMPEVRDHEPKIALDGDGDGLKFYRLICEQAPGYLKIGGKLIVEIGYDQAEAVCALFTEHGFLDVVCHKDLAGNDRVVEGHL